ncbi:Protein CBG27089 [Caenorhabditis briggsae]|uniref:Protein CBG27089 n=1 Tax=Caenorhabditis briggsae TaxID=6238 RepID=B6IHG5_CAEBR|nr:Protein CBG27089 [Caenorhabditis briggsae]CAR99345.1 Protein CBG27089 [Caenorhabditis briggsae]
MKGSELVEYLEDPEILLPSIQVEKLIQNTKTLAFESGQGGKIVNE